MAVGPCWYVVHLLSFVAGSIYGWWVLHVGAQLVGRPLAECGMARARRTGGEPRARRARPADAVRPDRRPVRWVVRGPPGRGTRGGGVGGADWGGALGPGAAKD